MAKPCPKRPKGYLVITEKDIEMALWYVEHFAGRWMFAERCHPPPDLDAEIKSQLTIWQLRHPGIHALSELVLWWYNRALSDEQKGASRQSKEK